MVYIGWPVNGFTLTNADIAFLVTILLNVTIVVPLPMGPIAFIQLFSTHAPMESDSENRVADSYILCFHL